MNVNAIAHIGHRLVVEPALSEGAKGHHEWDMLVVLCVTCDLYLTGLDNPDLVMALTVIRNPMTRDRETARALEETDAPFTVDNIILGRDTMPYGTSELLTREQAGLTSAEDEAMDRDLMLDFDPYWNHTEPETRR